MTANYDAQIGIDWAESRHAICMEIGNERTSLMLENDSEAIHHWVDQLGKRFERVAIALEKTRSMLVNILTCYDWIDLYLIDPTKVANYRKTFTPSGAKNDEQDATAILELLMVHRDKFSCVKITDTLSRKLHSFCQERRNFVDQRTKYVEELTAKLKRYYPQAMILAGDLTRPMACRFLAKFSTLEKAKEAGPNALRAFYYANKSRSATVINRRLEAVKTAVAVCDDEYVIAPLEITVRALAQQIADCNTAIDEFDAVIAQTYAQHQDKAIFDSLPGAGAVLAPRLASEMTSDRNRYANAEQVQRETGTAPVTEQSGNSCWVHRRWRCRKFSLQTFHEFAQASVHQSEWAAAYVRYRKATNRNATYASIIRSLAFKWIRIIYACWRDNKPYDEQAYIAALIRRKSPTCQYL